jgi:hypothetical protein
MPRPIGRTINLSTTFIAASWEVPYVTGPGWCVSAMSTACRWPHFSSSPLTARGMCRYTTPGGYSEFIDLDLHWESPDGSLRDDHASRKFNLEFINAFRSQGKEPCPGPLFRGLLKEAGFRDIHVQKHVLPVGTWPADPHLVWVSFQRHSTAVGLMWAFLRVETCGSVELSPDQ